jgi:segregation and condensation protein B
MTDRFSDNGAAQSNGPRGPDEPLDLSAGAELYPGAEESAKPPMGGTDNTEGVQAPSAAKDSDRKVVEAIMLLADDPVPARHVGEVLERPRADVEALLRDLAAEYERDDRGFVLRETAGGWRMYTNPDCHPWLERFVKGHTPARLTGAALEVLAIIAYKGPLSRAQIAEIRGVDSDGVVRTLTIRGLIEETGRDSGPGTPVLFGVTRDFLEGMGLRSLDELPALKEFMPDAEAVEEMEARLSPNV